MVPVPVPVPVPVMFFVVVVVVAAPAAAAGHAVVVVDVAATGRAKSISFVAQFAWSRVACAAPFDPTQLRVVWDTFHIEDATVVRTSLCICSFVRSFVRSFEASTSS